MSAQSDPPLLLAPRRTSKSIWMESLVSTALVKKPCFPSGKRMVDSFAPSPSREPSVSALEFPLARTADDARFPSREASSVGGDAPRREFCRGPVADHHRRDALDLHGGAGLHRRQRFLDAHCRKPLRHHQRSDLGADFVPGGQWSGHSDFRMARQSLWTEEPALRVYGRLHRGLSAVWNRPYHGSSGDLPGYPGRLWRIPATLVASRAVGGLPSQATRQSDGDLGAGGDCSASARTGYGRLADRQLLMAVGLLHQLARGSDFRPHDQGVCERSPLHSAFLGAGGFLGIGHAVYLGGGAPDHAGQRAGSGLVRLPIHRVPGSDVRGSAHLLDSARVDGTRSGCRPARVWTDVLSRLPPWPTRSWSL